MGEPAQAILEHRALNQIGVRRERPELKHLSRAAGKDINRDSASSGERTRRRPNRGTQFFGVADSIMTEEIRERRGKAGQEGESPVSENEDWQLDPEYRGTRETPWETGWTTIQA